MSDPGRDLLVLDHLARERAQVEFRRPLLVEAGAGTGKTTTLVARVLAWCLGPGWEERAAPEAGEGPAEATPAAAAVLGGLVAITFTEAAAAQMASRVAEALAMVASGREAQVVGFDAGLLDRRPGHGARQERARALLGALDHLTVETLHAYCRGLLAAHPLEAGVQAHLTIDAEESLAEETAREVVLSAIAGAFQEGPDHPLLAVLRSGASPEGVVTVLCQLLRQGAPAEALAGNRFSRGELSALREELAGALADLAGALGERLVHAARNAGEVSRAVSASREVVAGDLDPGALGRLAALWRPGLVHHLKGWCRGDFGAAEGRLLGESLEKVREASARLAPLLDHVARLDPETLELLRRAFHPLHREVERRLRASGVATFPSLLRDARDLLRRHPEVAGSLRRRLRQVLVDEFQDTDPLQCDLVSCLALEGPEEERPGLFAVGDPKQSIYGWRDADLAAYDAFKARVLGNGEVLTLSRNFRSAGEILEEVERVIEGVMVERPGIQPAFRPLVPSAERGSGGFARGPWRPAEHWVLEGEEVDDGAVRQEAGWVAADIARLHREEGVLWHAIAVLLRATGPLETFLDALRAADVPFAVSRNKAYYQRREIIDATALVRTILHPGDHLALLTLLRSPMVGVPDAALLPLWTRDLPRLATDLGAGDGTAGSPEAVERAVREAAAAVPPDVPGLARIAGWEESLLSALRRLSFLRESFRTQPADAFLDAVRLLFLPESTEACRHLGKFRLANLERFFRDLEAALVAARGDVSRVLRRLRMGVLEAREAQEALPRESGESAVQVATIHAAKGLEFDHVYLVQLHAGTRSGEHDEVRAELLEGRWEYSLLGHPTPGFHRVASRRREVEEAERVRLLYVAMTRACRRLVLVGRWAAKAGRPAASLLGIVRRRRPAPDLAALRRGALRRGWVDGDGARWVFPDLLPAARTERGMRPLHLAAALPTPSLAHLEARRRAAATRMQRRWAGVASGGERRAVEAAEEGAADGALPFLRANRAAALAAGAAVHRALEVWDLLAPVDEEAAAQAERLAAYLPPGLDAGTRQEALDGARDVLARWSRSRLLERLRDLAPLVLGREVPVLLPPPDAEGAPLAFVSGVVDLVYRDPASGEPVVVDFKTDHLLDGEDLAARASSYGPQQAIYAAALERALELEKPPRCELWFVWADSVIVASE